jgi:hypothetical protein
LEWFYIVGGLFLAMSYFWFIDDAFIYYRYVDNLVFLGNGLVYNQGEYVEGFSSPFWVLLLSLIRATGATYVAAIRLVTCASFVLFGLMLVKLNRSLSPEGPVINFPLAYLAFAYGVSCYFSSGLETPLIQLVAVAYALYILNTRSKILQLALAVSPLIRHELLIPFVLCALWGWNRSRRFPFGMVFAGALFLGSWLLFRVYHYADLFPNTFYLKDTIDIKQGLLYLHDTLACYHFYVVAAIFLGLTLVLIRKGLRPEISQRLMMVVTALSVTLYVVKIGGDPRHFRFLAFPFCLAACAFSGLAEHFYKTFCSERLARAVPAAGVALALFSLSCYPVQLDRHPLLFHPEHQTVNKINDAWLHRISMPLLRYFLWEPAVTKEKLLAYKQDNPQFKYSGITAHYHCLLMYCEFDKRAIHLLGLTDAILARTEMEAERPAHKFGLVPLAKDMVRIYESCDEVGRGMYRKAVEDGNAPEWIEKNLETIEVIEQKIYNRHDFGENLKLAFTFPDKIRP